MPASYSAGAREADGMSRGRKLLKWTGLGLALLLVLAALPVLWIETRCVEAPATASAPAVQSLLAPADRRPEVNSYLTYPEWSIVHAYEDLAAVARRGSESDYPYLTAITSYWSNLCDIARFATRRGDGLGDYRVMLHVIGLSFAGEMSVKGLWETTIGRLTTLLRGAPTPEDRFALAVADDYAKFLRQTPWYEYPFGAKLIEFWRTTPLFEGNLIRKIERRIALSLEWGVKSLYARLIAIGAATDPAPLRIKSVVADLQSDDAAADPRIKVVEARPGATIIETDRYQAFTAIMRGLAARGRNFSEIAGNRNIMVTVFAPSARATAPAGTTLLFAAPVAAKPGFHRLALDVKVPALLAFMRGLEAAGLTLDHVYDY
jgi:hypothetical protein